MKDLKKIFVKPNATIKETISVIDKSSMQIALVVDEQLNLKGTVTDGDIRRAILAGYSLDDFVVKIMNSSPKVCRIDEDRESILARMKIKGIHQMPLLNSKGEVVGLETIDELLQAKLKDNIVVLMAGGLGTRLRPLTEDCPKPMLKIGGRPILETILINFINQGFKKFYISLNYKSEMIMEYFGDGSKWGAEIFYLREDQKLGTAGALSLLPQMPELPFIVMNGDLLTKVDFNKLLEFHIHHNAEGTMCVREYDFQVPYGVVKTENHRIIGIDEKPIQKFFVNAGIYVLNPKSVTMIPQNVYFDMPSLFEKLVSEKIETSVFPVREYWLDIGQMSDYDRANGEFWQVFK